MLQKLNRNLTRIWLILLTILSLILIGIALTAPKKEASSAQLDRPVDTVTIRTANEEYQTRLPIGVKNMESGSEVEVSFTIPGDAEMLYFSMIYTPLKVYVNDTPAYSYADEETVSPVFPDPPTNYATIELNSIGKPQKPDASGPEPPDKPDFGKDQPSELPEETPESRSATMSDNASPYEIRMVYTVPYYRDKVMINAPMYGTSSQIHRRLNQQFGIPLAFALIFMLLGIILIAMSFFLQRFEFTRKLLIWPGLFALLAGIWQICDNTLAIYIFDRPTLLYVLMNLSMFSLIMPIYRYAMVVLDMEESKLLKFFAKIQGWSVIAVIALQLFGILPFHFCSSVFSVLLPVCLVVLTVYTLLKHIHNPTFLSGCFVAALVILTVTETLELTNKNIFGRKNVYFFQFGMLTFIVLISIVALVYFKKLQTNAMQVTELKYNAELQERIIEAQKIRNELLISHYEEVRKQRHDFRHHVRTLEELLSAGEYDKLSQYLKSISDEMPVYAEATYCNNTVLNSTIGYYAQFAKKKNIHTTIRVSIPDKNEHISDANLCVIFGNMLENAIEACERIDGDKRFINLSSQENGKMLFITMDNSCAPDTLTEQNGKYFSSKRDGHGQGLKSITSMVEQHDGSASFKVEGTVFKTNVCVRL